MKDKFNSISRRDFGKMVGVTAAAVFLAACGVPASQEESTTTVSDPIEKLINENFDYVRGYTSSQYYSENAHLVHTMFILDTNHTKIDEIDTILNLVSNKEKQVVILLEKYEKMKPVHPAQVILDQAGTQTSRARDLPNTNVLYFGWDNMESVNEAATYNQKDYNEWLKIAKDDRNQSMIEAYQESRATYPNSIVVIIAGDGHLYDLSIEEHILGIDPNSSYSTPGRDPSDTIVLSTKR